MAKLYQPRTWNDIKKIYNAIQQKLPNLLNSLNSETTTLIKFISTVNDASGIIEECIKQCPNFVNHVNYLKYYLEQLNICYKCMNNQKWLQSQPEWNEYIDDESNSSNSSGGGNIMDLYSSFQYNLNLVNEVNLNVNLIKNITYTLSHSQDKYYNKMAIRDLTRELSRQQQLSKSKQKELTQEQIKDIMYQKQKSSHER